MIPGVLFQGMTFCGIMKDRELTRVLCAMLICPLCKEDLVRTEGIFRCGQGHSFDVAREGYVNLLLSHQKSSPSPGDSKEMLASRRRFLERGHYAPLSDRINQIVAARLADVPGESGRVCVLDTGCGEGYYIHRLRQCIGRESDCFGMDISKEAVQMGARKYQDIFFVVASIHKIIPFPDHSLDVLLNVFAPRNPAEFSRVLRPQGTALVVVPTGDHLAQLHEALGVRSIKGEKESQTVAEFAGFFSGGHAETLRYSQALAHADLLDLIKMTPAYWRLSEDAWAKAQEIASLEIEFAFTLLVFP